MAGARRVGCQQARLFAAGTLAQSGVQANGHSDSRELYRGLATRPTRETSDGNSARLGGVSAAVLDSARSGKESCQRRKPRCTILIGHSRGARRFVPASSMHALEGFYLFSFAPCVVHVGSRRRRACRPRPPGAATRRATAACGAAQRSATRSASVSEPQREPGRPSLLTCAVRYPGAGTGRASTCTFTPSNCLPTPTVPTYLGARCRCVLLLLRWSAGGRPYSVARNIPDSLAWHDGMARYVHW